MPATITPEALSELLSRPTISIDELSSVVGVGRGTLYDGARNGDFPTIRIGRLMRVPTAAVRRMLLIDAATA